MRVLRSLVTAVVLTILSGPTAAQADEAGWEFNTGRLCLFKSAKQVYECELVDYNGDGTINFGDLALFKSNKGNIGSTSYRLLKACFFQKASAFIRCSKEDRNHDGVVNFVDLAIYKSETNTPSGADQP